MHMDVLVATDFFTTEVWTTCSLVTYYILFFLHLASRKVHVAGVPLHPDQRWMAQIARNVILLPTGRLNKGNGEPIHCRERLGGLLKFYKRDAA
jgi:putative transposase